MISTMQLMCNDYYRIISMIMKHMNFVTLVDLYLNFSESVQALDKEYCYFYSQYGIRVVEVRQKNGEVLKHWEFLDGAPQQNVPMLMADLFTGNAETVAVYDGNGECADFNVSQFKSTLQASP